MPCLVLSFHGVLAVLVLDCVAASGVPVHIFFGKRLVDGNLFIFIFHTIRHKGTFYCVFAHG